MKEKGYFIGDKSIHKDIHFFSNGRRMCDGKRENDTLLFVNASIFVGCDECRDANKGKIPNWMILDLIEASEVIKSHLHRFTEDKNDTN